MLTGREVEACLEREIFLHVGYKKTASTWLQKKVFSSHPEINFLGKPVPDPPDRRLHDLIREIKQFPDNKFDPNEFRDRFEELFDQFPNQTKIFGISREELSGGHLSIGEHHFYIAERLHRIFSDDRVRILIGIRNQLNLLPSQYAEQLKHGELRSAARYFFSPDSLGEVLIQTLRYHNFLDRFASRFGRNNLHVYLQEALADNPERVVQEICDFLSVEPLDIQYTDRANVRPSSVALSVLRLANRLFRTPFNPGATFSPITLLVKPLVWILHALGLYEHQVSCWRNHPIPEGDRIIREKQVHEDLQRYVRQLVIALDSITFARLPIFNHRLPDRWRDYFADFYREDNRKTMQQYDLPLDKYDYPLPE